MKINIGCGNLPLEGYKNIDISKKAKADEFYDITKGIKEKDLSIDEINAGCVFCQIDNFMFVMNECNRILKNNGILKGYVPSTDTRVMHLDPNDKRFFQVETFDYFNINNHSWKEFGRVYGYLPWSETKAEINHNGIIFFELIK